MDLSKKAVAAAYEKHANSYDFALKLYQLMGLRMAEYRAHAVELLCLKRGDCVVDLGCGTGLSFPFLIQAIGPEGRLIGVDVSAAMLACAQERIERAHWNNVHLVHGDIAEYDFPGSLKGALSIGVFGYIPERDRVMERLAQALVPGGRVVLVDGKRPERWPTWLFKLFVWCSSPFGVTQQYFDGRTWESVERFFQETTFEEVYGGLLYISSGMAAPSPA
jgi:demethylmenaquinone methyltransferase/2-methoxy-6-polyprenyl-1,4-benzoquinol methylase